jgi:two-component system, NarL family, nitrate/nitrite response regulator NarL
MIDQRLQQAAETRKEAAAAGRRSGTVASTIAASTTPPVGRARDWIDDLRIRTLTRRERELLGLLANGWSTRRIANECLLSPQTVRTRVQTILVKLGVHSRLEAAAFAFDYGLVLPEGSVVAPRASMLEAVRPGRDPAPEVTKQLR